MLVLLALLCCSCSEAYKPVVYSGSVTVGRTNEIVSVTIEFPGMDSRSSRFTVRTKADLERTISYIENMQKDLKYVLVQLQSEEEKAKLEKMQDKKDEKSKK